MCGQQIPKEPHFITESTNPFLHKVKYCPPSPGGLMCLFHSCQLSLLAILSMSVKVFVEVADAFVKVVQVINEHPISNHLLLSDTTLQFIPLPASKPSGAPDQFFGVLFKVSQDPDVVIHPEHGPLLVPTINHFGGREGDPYMEQSRNT